MMKLTVKKYILLGLSIAGILTLTAFSIYFLYYYSAPGPLETKKIVFIQKGSGLTTISNHLYEQGIIDCPWFFELHLRLRQTSHQLRAGEFELQPHQSPEEVAEALTKGPLVQHSITVPEGMHTQEVVQLLKAAPLLANDNPLEAKEGDILPETYYYTWNEPSTALLDRMKHSMRTTLEKAWHLNKTGHPLQNPEEVLILASIVEKETGKANERAHVAAVFLNRLRLKMLLQSDPTVIYGLEHEHNRSDLDLSKADLQIPSRYNTYLNHGLPPTPICNPGKASIEAVMNPVKTEDLYFVADGTGGHVFAKTYEEHMRNHKKWRAIRDGKKF